MGLELVSLSRSIENVFKSLMQSGRPDVYDEHDKVITSEVYVDLFENDYMLRQVLDNNHIILKGRRGTGKSTIFVKAEDYIKKNKKNTLPIYINLQSCYEEIKTYCADQDHNELVKMRTYRNFLNEIFKSIKLCITDYDINDNEMDDLFFRIENGEYIDVDFKKEYEIEEFKSINNKKDLGGKVALKEIALTGSYNKGNNNEYRAKKIQKEIRIYSVSSILNNIKEILKKNGINKVYLFLDDFSELNKDRQKVIVDSLISPIIASYNDYFNVKIAAYPGRIYVGNSDSTKLIPVSLDFYDAFERNTKNYTGIEKDSMDYIKRTLEKRLKIYTNGQISIEDIFDLSKASMDTYLKLLFECTAAIPRTLGFILNYCYLGSINNGDPITIDNIKSSTLKYYEDNIYPDFINDIRFKQSFYDDKNLLDQVAQKNLIDEIVKYLYTVKRNIIKNYQEGKIDNDLFKETIESHKNGNSFWFPTSYFYISKDYEYLLKTLELSYLVNKVNEGSIRGAGDKGSYYSLNYGLCIAKKIDFGRPELRRKYDYWRQAEFDLTNFIPKVLSNIEVIECINCSRIYSELEYNIYKENKYCFKCTSKNSVIKKNKFESKLQEKIDEWRDKSLPDVHIEILRILYNNKDKRLSAQEIGTLIDKHNLTVTNAARTLKNKEYIDYINKGKRYYFITEKSIAEFFSESIEIELYKDALIEK
ncbi:hypothetical protein IR151_06945 [Clostridioides sp. ES-S-0006-03]|uniref:hypothetical protein n=1 Tax=Clostridioides sp. ES-S-0006-03 TaxID=2770775 RepID=UPI001D0C7893|nr:hypothetical protein [Clostridioides sp. ES-S-0006-03]